MALGFFFLIAYSVKVHSFQGLNIVKNRLERISCYHPFLLLVSDQMLPLWMFVLLLMNMCVFSSSAERCNDCDQSGDSR